MADTVEELQFGQELEFEGEFDKSYYFTMPNSFSHVKFACLNPTDSDGNRILNMRVRYFQESSLEEERGPGKGENLYPRRGPERGAGRPRSGRRKGSPFPPAAGGILFNPRRNAGP